ncbi:hypothetical protein FRC0191_01314 [Corynebacterium diphtheriae]|nr:hypothetical protein FRC0191_01314 [Corynebacterium diphtheriae]
MSNVDELFQRSNIAMFFLSNAITIAGNGKFHDASFFGNGAIIRQLCDIEFVPYVFIALFITVYFIHCDTNGISASPGLRWRVKPSCVVIATKSPLRLKIFPCVNARPACAEGDT